MQLIKGHGVRITPAMAQAAFLHDLLTITGDTRLLYTPVGTDTTTATDKSLNARTITWDATVASRLSALGLGYAQTFDGSTNGGTAPDAANLTFTSGALSIVALVNMTNTANQRNIVTKWNNAGSLREWRFYYSTTDILTIEMFDESADAAPSRAADAASAMGAWALVGCTVPDVTDANIASTVLYQNGLAVASTATAAGGFSAMEDLAVACGIGQEASVVRAMQGSMALVVVSAKSLSASDHWAIKTLVNSYFGLSL